MSRMRASITISGQHCEVEALYLTRFLRDRGHPCAEVSAPDGYEFSGGETALSVHCAASLDEIERTETLTATA